MHAHDWQGSCVKYFASTGRPAPAAYRCAVGGNRHAERQHRPRCLPVILTALALVGAACDDGTSSPENTTTDGEPVVTEIGPADAITALVRWHVDVTEPVVDDAGDVELPIVYLASATGETIDVGIQAAVAERTADDAVVRFADDRSEAVDDGADEHPVKDDGVLLLLGELPEPAPTVTFPVTRYRAADDEQILEIEVAATSAGAELTATPTTPS